MSDAFATPAARRGAWRHEIAQARLVSQAPSPVVEEGALRGVFRGFRNRRTVFEFQDGGAWQQDEVYYAFAMDYAPRARVIRRDGCFLLLVDGRREAIQVKRVWR